MKEFLEKAKKEYASPFISALIFGLAAHMFVFTNKLMNADEVDSLFGKGATVTSGRWGLELVRFIFPNRSMPWLYGIITMLLFALSSCLIIRIFNIRGKLTQMLLAGMISVFPSLTGTFCFMFTSSSYGLSFFMTVLAVMLFYGKKGLRRWIFSAVLLAAAISIYQSYIAVAASLFVLCIFKSCLAGENSFKKLLFEALSCLSVLVIAVGLYFAVTVLVLKITGSEFNFYVRQNVYSDENSLSIPGRLRMAYDFFSYYFSYREFALITGEASRYGHIALLILCVLGVAVRAVKLFREKKIWSALGILGTTLILPLAMNCLFLVFSKESIHSLALYSFISLYVLLAMLMDSVFAGDKAAKKICRDIAYLCLMLAIVSNIYFANKVYLKLYLQYENAYSFYSILLDRVQNTEGFDESCALAIIGDQDNKLRRFNEIDDGYIQGPSYDLVNIYSREKFFRNYLGSAIPFASNEDKEKLKNDERFLEMSEYPYDGSIRKINDFIVVRLG